MRVRGLKPHAFYRVVYKYLVAPHAGAWIETISTPTGYFQGNVAPHAGAWIETNTFSLAVVLYMSHPMRVRGLKQVQVLLHQPLVLSHPMRVRGLKP